MVGVVMVMLLVLNVLKTRQCLSGNQGGMRLVCNLVRLGEAPHVDREQEEGEPGEESGAGGP